MTASLLIVGEQFFFIILFWGGKVTLSAAEIWLNRELSYLLISAQQLPRTNKYKTYEEEKVNIIKFS